MPQTMTETHILRLALEDGQAAVKQLCEEWNLTGRCDAETLCGNPACAAIGCLLDKQYRIERALATTETALTPRNGGADA